MLHVSYQLVLWMIYNLLALHYNLKNQTQSHLQILLSMQILLLIQQLLMGKILKNIEIVLQPQSF